MKNLYTVFTVFLAAGVFFLPAMLSGADVDMSNIHWLGHSSFRVDGKDTVVYVDPFKLGTDPKKADLILITHDHDDHCSIEDIEKIRKDGTLIVCSPPVAKKVSGNVKTLGHGEKATVKGVKIEAVSAFNINKFRKDGQPYHSKKANYAGFVFTVDGKTIYHAGDTDFLPDAEKITADVALVPVSGTYVMTAAEAAECVKHIKPKVAVPMHIGRHIGSMKDAKEFKKKSTIPVVILKMEE